MQDEHDAAGSGGPTPEEEAREEAVAAVVRVVIRCHAASPLTGTAPFWQRVVREVLAAAARTGDPHDAGAVAAEAAPALSGSPVTNSGRLWRGIVRTVLHEAATHGVLWERLDSVPLARSG